MFVQNYNNNVLDCIHHTCICVCMCVCVCVSEMNDSERLLYHDSVLVLPVNENSVILNWTWIKFKCIL